MRMIERSTAFKRDYKRIKKMPRYKNNLDSLISDILESLLITRIPNKEFCHASVLLAGIQSDLNSSITLY